MTANLGLVAHAAQRHPYKLAVEAAGNALAERGLADAGRTDQAQNRCAEFGILDPLLSRALLLLAFLVKLVRLVSQLAHRQELQDALLDIVQAVVVIVQDGAGADDVQNFLVALAPRHVGEPVDVIAHDGAFGTAAGGALQSGQFLEGFFLDLAGHARHFNFLAQGLDLGRPVFAAAEFLADGLHLLAQIVLALVGVHLLFDAPGHFLVHIEALEVAAQVLQHQGQALLNAAGVQHRLFFLDGPGSVVGDLVGQRSGVGQRFDALELVVVQPQVLVLALVLFKGRFGFLHQDPQFVGVAGLGVQGLNPHPQVAGRNLIQRFDALLRLHQHLVGVVGQANDLLDDRQRADFVKFGGHRVIGAGVALGDHQYPAVRRLGLVHRAFALGTAHINVHGHAGHDHHISQCNNG